MAETPRVVIGIPTYNEQVSMHLVNGLLGALGNVQAQVACHASSLLAHGFNQLWGAAVMQADAGNADYFCMCHADIGPQGEWITQLLQILNDNDADVVSATIPIKTTAVSSARH
jgi:hypothetical protein